MCHLTDVQHKCTHWSRRVSYSCPASRKASCISDPSKTFPMPCTNADTIGTVKSVEECSICRRLGTLSLPVVVRTHNIVWNDNYFKSDDLWQRRVSLEWKEIEWFKADGSTMDTEELAVMIKENTAMVSNSELEKF
jgi:hypothetical protein